SITSITVDVGDGNDVVNVQSNTDQTTVKHSGPGSLTVNVGNSNNGVQSIRGALTVTAGANNVTNVNVDDSADKGNHGNFPSPPVTLSNSAIVNLAPAAINYQQSSTGALNVTVTGGSGQDRFQVSNTPLNSGLESGSMTLNTGSGSNLVTVQATSRPRTTQRHD